MRILLVEDDERVAGAVSSVLRDAGHAVDVERDAVAGLVTFETEPEDLVVLDVRLPGLAGGGIERPT